MKNDLKVIKDTIVPVRLHLELKNEYLTDYQKRILRRYAESSTGESITRDILIPSDMPLHNLHYAIQKLFGWQNSHLRSFHLPEDVYNKLTGSTVKGWSDLVGILFQPPTESKEDIFWDDDYQKGSINAWLKKKYVGPYIYGGTMENEEVAKKDIQELLDRYKIIDLTLEEMHSSLIIDGGTESLLERLDVDKVIEFQGEDVNSKKLFPTTNELIYNYDFGDDWMVKITKQKNCDDLLKQNIIDEYELEEAKQTVLSKYKPVCINKEGISVLDDVGGLSGFAKFLGIVYEGEDKEERASARAWAQSLGWNPRKISNKMML